jgi:hypothetical protein
VLALEPPALPAMVLAAPSWPSAIGRGLLICDTYRSPRMSEALTAIKKT